MCLGLVIGVRSMANQPGRGSIKEPLIYSIHSAASGGYRPEHRFSGVMVDVIVVMCGRVVVECRDTDDGDAFGGMRGCMWVKSLI